MRDLVHQVDLGEHRDRLGDPLANNMAFLKAQAIVDQFALAHELVVTLTSIKAPARQRSLVMSVIRSLRPAAHVGRGGPRQLAAGAAPAPRVDRPAWAGRNLRRGLVLAPAERPLSTLP